MSDWNSKVTAKLAKKPSRATQEPSVCLFGPLAATMNHQGGDGGGSSSKDHSWCPAHHVQWTRCLSRLAAEYVKRKWLLILQHKAERQSLRVKFKISFDGYTGRCAEPSSIHVSTDTPSHPTELVGGCVWESTVLLAVRSLLTPSCLRRSIGKALRLVGGVFYL